MVSSYHLLRLKVGQLFQHLTITPSTPHSSGYADPRKSKSSSYWLTPIGFGGLQFIFFAFASQGVTHFNTLGLTRAEIAITLLSPPVCGGFFQPYFGSWSDQVRSPWGRRKPFIIIGTVVLIFSTLCLGWTESIARLLTGTSQTTTAAAPTRIVVVGLTMFWTFAMFTAIQAVQVGLRALITDGCTPTEQAKANAWASGYTNLAAALLNLFAYMDWPVFRGAGNTVFMNMSVPAALCLIVTIYISCVTATEPPVGLYSRGKSPRRSLRAVWRFFATTSKQIRTICLVQVFAWFGWFPFLFYTVTYVNGLHEREMGEMAPAQARREQDSRMGALTLLVFSVVSLLMAMVLPNLVQWLRVWSMATLWVISQALFGVSMLGSYAIRSSHGTVFLFGSTGFSWAASTWVPYALLGAETSRAQQLRITLSTPRSGLVNSEAQASPILAPYDATDALEHDYDRDHDEEGAEMVEDNDLSDKIGLIYGIHNLSICIPQILLSLGTGLIWMLSDDRAASRTDAQQSADLVWILRLGGIAAFVAMYYATGLKEPFADDVGLLPSGILQGSSSGGSGGDDEGTPSIIEGI